MEKVIFLGLVIALIIGSCTQEKKSPNEDLWQVVSWERMYNDTLYKLGVDVTGSEIKSWTKSHFLFVGNYMMLKDSTKIPNSGCGIWELDGTHYTERYLNFVRQNKVGSPIRILLEIKNDTLTQTWPCDENWQVNKSQYNIQKLIRLE